MYECWGLTKDYLDDIKFYIRGEAEWDTSSYFRSSSITYAEEFLKKNYDSELIHLLLGIFKADEDKMMGYKPDEGIIRSPIHKELIKGKDFSSYVRLRSNAYAALAVAVGEYEISYDHIFKAIEENHLNALDFSIIQKAEKMIQNRI